MPGSLAGQHRNRKAQANWKIKAHDAAFEGGVRSLPCGSVSFASDIWLGHGRGNFDVSYFTGRFPGSFQVHSLYGIGPSAEEYDRRKLLVNANVVPGLIEIVCSLCRRFPAVSQLLW